MIRNIERVNISMSITEAELTPVTKRRFLGGEGEGKNLKKAMAAAIEDFEREVLRHRGLLPVKHNPVLRVAGIYVKYPKMTCRVVIISDVEIAADREN